VSGPGLLVVVAVAQTLRVVAGVLSFHPILDAEMCVVVMGRTSVSLERAARASGARG